jgi:hypothetical protein
MNIIETFITNRNLVFYKRKDFFHATNGISSATDIVQDIETKELFEIYWSKKFEDKNLVKQYLQLKKIELDFQI